MHSCVAKWKEFTIIHFLRMTHTHTHGEMDTEMQKPIWQTQTEFENASNCKTNLENEICKQLTATTPRMGMQIDIESRHGTFLAYTPTPITKSSCTPRNKVIRHQKPCHRPQEHHKLHHFQQWNPEGLENLHQHGQCAPCNEERHEPHKFQQWNSEGLDNLQHSYQFAPSVL